MLASARIQRALVRVTRTLFAVVLLACPFGCSEAEHEPKSKVSSAPSPMPQAAPPVAPPSPMPQSTPVAPIAATNPRSAMGPRETWDVVMMQGSRVGHLHTVRQPLAEAGQPLVRTVQESMLSILRGRDRIDQPSTHTCTETPDGRLLSFESQTQLGAEPTVTRGRVEAGRLILETSAGGKPQVSTIPWSDEFGGFSAVEDSLLRRPMLPGDARTVKALMPIVNRVATMQLVAQQVEQTEMLPGEPKQKLLRIDARLQLTEPIPMDMPMVMWTDAQGDVRKTFTPGVDQATFRTTREQALAPSSAAPVDLLKSTTVRLAALIPNAHQSRVLRYLVTLDGGDLAKTFPSGGTQEVRATGPNTAEVTVRAVSPAAIAAAPIPLPETPPTEADSRATTLVQSDDPQVVALANEAAGTEQDPAKLAMRLENFVHHRLNKKNFSQALASAAEVARSLEGDCTEHAMLLAALLRARGIPARVAVGLVYLGSEPAFGFHMWTEAYLRGRWVPLDATLGQGGIGAAHLTIGRSSLDGPDALATLLPVAQVMGRLKIEALPGGE